MAVGRRQRLNREGHCQHRATLGLKLLTTLVRSPELNGVSEALVKTLKREYASILILHDGPAICALLFDRNEDYREVHLRSSLKLAATRVHQT